MALLYYALFLTATYDHCTAAPLSNQPLFGPNGAVLNNIQPLPDLLLLSSLPLNNFSQLIRSRRSPAFRSRHLNVDFNPISSACLPLLYTTRVLLLPCVRSTLDSRISTFDPRTTPPVSCVFVEQTPTRTKHTPASSPPASSLLRFCHGVTTNSVHGDTPT